MLHSSLSYMGAREHHVKQRDFPRLEARDIRLSFSTYIYGVLDLFVSASFGTLPTGEECCQIRVEIGSYPPHLFSNATSHLFRVRSCW